MVEEIIHENVVKLNENSTIFLEFRYDSPDFREVRMANNNPNPVHLAKKVSDQLVRFPRGKSLQWKIDFLKFEPNWTK